MHPAAPMPMAPPVVVRLSSALLFGVAGLTLLTAVIELVFTNTGLSVYRDAYTGHTGSGFASLVGATFDIFLAAGAAILAILNGHGRKNARITTFVLGGIFTFCDGLGAMTDGLHRPAHTPGPGSLARILPTAYGISAGILHIVTVLAGLAALILLALPAANRFFHNRQLLRYAYPAMAQLHVGYGPPTTTPVTGTPVPGAPFTGTPVPYLGPPRPEQPPHTGSIPAIDPWADHTDN